jgi:predicted RNA-binding Zn ribbon-like protein
VVLSDFLSGAGQAQCGDDREEPGGDRAGYLKAGGCPQADQAPELQDVTSVPAITDGQIAWALSIPPERQLAVRAVLAWGDLASHSPGRLRPCANDECRRFLVDHSKANAARWCSMTVCGNRMKARRHYERLRNTHAE